MNGKQIDPKEIDAAIEKSRKDGSLKKMITKGPFYFEGSLKHPGFIDRVDTKTGERQTGRVVDGEFIMIWTEK
jgi:hypothetical protein